MSTTNARTRQEPTLDEVSGFLRDLRAVSDRVMRFEKVPQAELDALDARKRALVEGIEPGSYDDGETS